ncbi:unnamed protein product [Rotaria sp. Silwood1]|nr:unnamed protein product [Rotaria sp. Silwood1]CAF1007242.1 unnamed protein product [Rotaria sp. Silwood1]
MTTTIIPTTITAAPTTATTTPWLPATETSTVESVATTGLEVQTNEESSVTAMISTTIITERPFVALFQCNFDSTPCFENDQLKRTSGNEFNPTGSSDSLERPKAPTSDVTSITLPTNNNEKCKLPYRLPLNGSMNISTWDMNFCYNNQCKTENGQTATCQLGLYGLVSLNSSEPLKTINESINTNLILRDSIGEQCLRFYYYFTFDEGQDWGQQIQVWIRSDDESDNERLITNLTRNDTIENKWQFHDVTFNSTFSNYTLAFSFRIDNGTETEQSILNQTIYFALDNIEIYDYNCSYVNYLLAGSTTTPSKETTMIPTSTATTTTTTPPSITASTEQDLGLILGLSLGLGIPFVLGILVGFIYYFKIRKPKQKWTPGAPTLETLYGITSTTVPKQPLSDVKSILSLTVPKNEFCVFPYSNPPETWPMYFCQRNSETNYTCPTRSGTGNCIIGKYALVQTPRAGSFDHMYTTIDTIQNHIDNFQCLDFYYYVPDTSFSAQISVGWSAGAAPFFLTDVKAKLENKWQHHQFTYENPRQTAYNIWFQMIRDGGAAGFSFALDEIKIFDGSCEFLTTIAPNITTSTTTSSITPTEESDLPLILGLVLGIGLSFILFFIGVAVYYFTIVKPKQKITVPNSSENEIIMASMNNTTNNTDTVDTVVS